jgi:hypothetical protein
VDSQPQPGDKGYAGHLQRLLQEAQRNLIAIDSLDGELVKTQVTRAAYQQRLWEIRQLIAEEKGDLDEARKSGKLALEYSTQQTRALKQSIADRLADLEAQLETQGKRKAQLRAI